jgi:hypothetical protein
MHPQIFSNAVMRTRSLLAVAGVLGITGCAPQLQTLVIGQTSAVAGPPTAAAPAVAAEVPVPESHSAQVLRYVVSVPRALRFHYQVTCPTAEREGTMGETFDTYRTRRLAELERERRAEANLIGAVVGSVAPPVRAQAGVSGPGGSATVVGEVNPGAAAAQAAHDALPPPNLPPGDMGANVFRGAVELGASPSGRCVLALTTDPSPQETAGAQVFLELIRLVDVEAEERARLEAIRVEQDKRARALRLWLLGSLQRRGADPTARERARATVQAQVEAENRRRQAAAEEDNRRRQAAAEEEHRRRQAATSRAEQERWQRDQEHLARLEAERLAKVAAENAARAKANREAAERQAQEWRVRQAGFALRWQLVARLQRLGADPLARQRAQALVQLRLEEENRRRQAATEEENRRRQQATARTEQERWQREQERLRQEQQAAAERARRETAERERREAAEREQLARVEAERQARFAVEYEVRVKAEREAVERREREWRARQAGFALRWQLLARLQRQGADPDHRQRLEEARLAARRDEQRRLYEARARRELDAVVARRAAIDLRFNMLARLRSIGADPDFRRKRDEAMFREMDAEARRTQTAQAAAAERVRWETQAAIDLRVLAKLRLRQVGAVDRPSCPPPPVESPPPPPYAGATWIAGRYAWNGIAWMWASGHYERPPETGAVWVPPANIAVSGTLVIRPGRWVRIDITPPR